MVEFIDGGHFVRNKATLFVPMWIGSAVGIIAALSISLRICYNVIMSYI